MTNSIGIRREHKSRWERRSPLVPLDIEELIRDHGIDFTIQTATNRAHADEEFTRIGAQVAEDLSSCDIVFGVKEFPEDFLRPGGIYMFFSHTIKGQPYNMDLLRRLVDMKCTLIDYELVKDEMGRRLIFFGHYAGRAGMMDALWTLGRRLEYEGFRTPFSMMKQAYEYLSLGRAKEAVRELMHELERNPLPRELRPMIFGFAGYGNVSKGAQVILDILEPREIEPGQLDEIEEGNEGAGLYKVIFKEEHIVEPAGTEKAFDLGEYYKHPERFRPVFERYVPHLTVLMNSNYWDDRYPRLLTKDYVKRLYSDDMKTRLKVIGDISCDIEGGVECTLKCTQPDNPVYVFDVETMKAVDGWKGRGPVILAVDNLPAEFPWESSMYFSGVLKSYLPDIVRADFQGSFEEIGLPDEIKKAIILYRGEFTPTFGYMSKFIDGTAGGPN